ncbi:PQQ-binding-like beta-propeller repeat protein [Amantichitinum ursilacus]|uniref:Outer membrane protein assembly factor BamB n=1 Tax=Amantichitinum ursilacus TaxID=857265 RepID=A0A0N0GNI8_9NEIS|nr:PQQ-binding-like beta-propeller repeat protein [Amantichitinum ursilacus]KPC52872.1 hypothetical protein WG78_10295 [Amantichitinum ursilacus]
MKNIKWARACGALGLATLLVACGGGGGGDGSSSANKGGAGTAATPTGAPTPTPAATPTPAPAANVKFALQFDQQQISVNAEEDVSVPIVLTGTLNTPVADDAQVQITDSNTALIHFRDPPLFTLSADGKTFTLRLLVDNDLVTNQYQGNLAINVCANTNCSSMAGTQAVTVPYALNLTPVKPSAGTLSADINQLHASYAAGVAVPQTVHLRFSQALTDHHKIRLTSPNNHWLNPVFTQVLVDTDRMGATATVMFDPNLLPNSYSGVLQIDVCMDLFCARVDNAARLDLPYQIDVGARVAPAALTALPGAADWSATFGSATHASFVPVTLDPARFAPRWMWQTRTGESLTPQNAVVTAQNTAWVAATQTIVALSEYDGSETAHRWTGSQVSGLATHNGAAYGAPTLGNNQGTWAAYDASGNLLAGSNALTWARNPSTTAFNPQSPVFYDQTLYVPAGHAGGVRAIDPTSNSVLFDAALTGQTTSWSPAVDAQYVYQLNGMFSFTTEGMDLQTLDRRSGALVRALHLPSALQLGNTEDHTVIASDRSLLVTGSSLAVIDKASNSVRWSLYMPSLLADQPAPAVGNGVVFVARSTPYRLEARDEMTGAMLWSWQPPRPYGRFSGNLIVTNNLVFVGTDSGTYTISQTTHLPVWSTPLQGMLSLSANGTLYITTGVGYADTPNQVATVAAFNLH